MKLIYVTENLPFGHGEAFIIPEVRALMAQGHEVLVVPLRPLERVVHTDAEPLVGSTLREPYLSPPILAGAFQELCRRPMGAIKPVGWAPRCRTPKVLFRSARAYAKGLWLGNVARSWGADHIHAHWAAATSTIAMIASRLSGVPWSFTAHRYDIVENELLTLKVRDASFARFISRSGIELARCRGIDVQHPKVIVLHMGIDLPEQLSCPLPRTGHNRQFTVLCPANMVPIKGHRYLIEAVSQLRERGTPVTVLLAGQGSLRGALEAQVKNSRLEERVQFLGQLSHTALIAMYRRREIDTVIIPSVDLGGGHHEGIPVSLMEAMAHHIPVIGTRTGGIPELLSDHSGIMVDPADPTALADAIGSLAGDVEYRGSLAARGRARIESHFCANRIASELAVHFGQHVNEGGR